MRVRGDILRTYQSVHTWTGIIAGLVLFIGFYAGSLTMFKSVIAEWATPPSHHLTQVPVQQLDNLVVQAITTFEKAGQGFSVNFNEHFSPMTWYEQGGQRGVQLNDTKRHATLSEQGELVTQVSPTNELGELIDMLHRTAGIAGKVGHEDLGVVVLGVASVLYFLALVSGVIFLLPTLVKSFLALRTNKGANRFWLDSHNLIGIVSLPFHLIIAWSVVVFAFHDVAYGGLEIVYGDIPVFERGERSTLVHSVQALPAMSRYIEKVNELTDGYDVEKMTFSRLVASNPSVAIHIINKREMMRVNTGDIIYMNPYTFEVSYSSVALSESDVYIPVVVSLFALHFGSYAGEWGQWLYFILGLLGAFLFYSGNLLWLEKRRKKQHQQSKSNRFMAALTIGVCLGSILAIVVTILSAKWLYINAIAVNNGYLYCYYVIFLSALVYSFFRGGAQAAIHLLQLLSLACLCIPLTSLFALLNPDSGLWTATTFATGMVDVTAGVFAVIFYYAASKTRHRAYKGERNSIWALPLTTERETSSDAEVVT